MKLSGIWTNYTSLNAPIPKGTVVGQVTAGLSGTVWMHIWESVTVEQANVVTVSSKTDGMLRFNDEGWQYFPFAETAFSSLGFVYDLACDRSGNLWFVASPTCVACFDGHFRRLFRPAEQGLPPDRGPSSILAVDLNNDIWVSFVPTGVFRFDSARRRWFEFRDPALSNTWVTNAAVDERGQVWFVVQGEKDTRILASVGDHLEDRDRLNVGFRRGDISAFMLDRNGRRWVGWSAGSGLGTSGIWASNEPGQPWSRFTTRDTPLPHPGITSLTLDKRNRVWAGTSEGFAIFDGESVAAWSMIIPGVKHGPLAMASVPNWLPTDQHTAFTAIGNYAAVDSQGRLWARSRNGVSVFDEAEPNEGP